MALKTILAAALCAASVAAAARDIYDLGSGWEFTIEGDTAATLVNLPHDYLIGRPWVPPAPGEIPDDSDGAANFRSRLSARAFKEPARGRYRRVIAVPDSLRGRRVLLDFEGIMLTGDVYLDGERVGGTDYGYLGFEVDVTRRLRYGAADTLVVEADTGEPANSRWYTGGGLYRPVRLVATSPDLYLARHGLWVATPEVADSAAAVVVGIEAVSRTRDGAFLADVTLRDHAGRVVASRVDTIAVNRRWKRREYLLDTIRLASPALWDVDSPRLYTASVALRRPGSRVAEDSLSRRFGIRSARFTPDSGLVLNGRKVLLKGIANHHTLGALGAAAYPRAIEKRLRMLKDFGFNHVRTSHNPYSEEFLDMCDSLGILVVDELYDKWLRQYAGGRADWTALWQRDIPEWVARDRSHPSVVMWSLGNELQGYADLPFNDWGVTAYRLQRELLRRYDASRPVTVAMHPRYRSLETDSLPAPLVMETDVASYNYRYMYFPGDRRRFPWMVFYQSEASRAAMPANFFEPDNERVAGLAYWGMIDYLGESAGWPAKGWNQGVFDTSLRPKPEAWLVKSMFADAPVARLGVADSHGDTYMWNDEPMSREALVEHWNFQPGDTLAVTVFSNQPRVELLLNGRSLGALDNPVGTPSARDKFLWPAVPYRAGRLEAVAYDAAGRRVATHSVETAGRPVRLVMEPDTAAWRADGLDLAHVRVRSVDAKGRVVPVATHAVTFELDAPRATAGGENAGTDMVGEIRPSIAALDNGDIYSDELHTPSSPTLGTRALHRGEALVILRSGTRPGAVTLRASAPGLRPATLTLRSVHAPQPRRL